MTNSQNLAAGHINTDRQKTPADLTATEAIAAMRNGRLTSKALVQSCLDRVKSLEPDIKAWAYLDSDLAIKQAEQADDRADRGEPIGPLNGIPVGIKDIIDTADMPTVCGSPIFVDNRPSEDAGCIAALRAAGAVIMGKTVTTELANMTPGPTCNPRNMAHTPGGSSSGSAAAVASAMVPLAVGTQTAGSVIRPAAFCGVYGLKPTFGAISRRGVLMQSHTLDTVGTYASTLEDLALITDAMAVHDVNDPVSLASPDLSLAEAITSPAATAPRFAFVQTPAWEQTDEVTKEAFAELVAFLGSAVVELEITALEDAIAAHRTIQMAEISAYYGPYLARAPERLSEGLTQRLQAGAQITARDYLQAIKAREPIYQSMAGLFDEYAAILTPAAPGPAPKGLDSTGDPIFNGMWTLIGVPAASLPLLEVNGLPIGVQLVGARQDEARLLQAACWLRDEVTKATSA